ncbi:MAG: hypothetical protein RIQ54_140 [Candidatus Parcubacteria bacterium]|jgi:hypothetical protein
MSNFEKPQDNNFSLSEQEKEDMEANLWYIKAREKVLEFLPDIDPDLTVDIQESVITPDNPAMPRYETPTLIFRHASNPNIKWTMEIKKNDDYIDTKLEDGVRYLYNKQKEQ